MLSAIYIKGFKTFARPVRMPLEGGVTAIVGPNGSGKSNITDAVLFALGEQSPGVLRAGAMSDLIFSGSEALPAAAVAEVTLVLDNTSGDISLPYREVSLTRRISRAGETEYRINGSRARLADVRAVAGEAGLGRHSILRQGAVDAIVAGGPSACRIALEEAAGLGVYRRRRLSASRRLEKADAQLEKSRQLEAEISTQLRRIESEAAAAREYRKLEGRYRELSLAHLYRVATRGLEGLDERLRGCRSRVEKLAAEREALAEEEEALGRRVLQLEANLQLLEGRLEAVEDGAEDLRIESLRAERTLLRLETGRGREGELRRSVLRLEGELRRVAEALQRLEEERGALEAEYSARREKLKGRQRAFIEARERGVAFGKRRSHLASELEGLRGRLARTSSHAGIGGGPSEEHLARLADATDALAAVRVGGLRESLERLRSGLGDRIALVEQRAEEVNRRRGSLAAAIGRAESRIGALRRGESRGAGTRLCEVIRARPGYEVAVEAALGEYGAGVLAENVDAGVKLLSRSERVALRLDARGLESNGAPPGRPLRECVEVVDRRYVDAVERLLDGIYVVERPGDSPDVNGYITVTREGVRLTRTSVSLGSGGGGFVREARLAAEIERLGALKRGPGEIIYGASSELSGASDGLDLLARFVQRASVVAERASRAQAQIVRESTRRREAAGRLRREALERQEEAALLTREIARTTEALHTAEQEAERAKEEIAAAAGAADAARIAVTESDRRLARLRAAISEGASRRARISRELEQARASIGSGGDVVRRLGARAADASGRLFAAVRERRNALRQLRSEVADMHRRAAAQQTQLVRRAAELAGGLATARAEAERMAVELERAEISAARAAGEIRDEWGATLESARREAQRHPESTDAERQLLARKLKRFGDVNLLALSQESHLRERYEFVAAQRADAEAAADELDRVIRSIDREIEARFSETFGRVRRAFGEMVPRMMQGASGVLDLSEEGVEIGLRLGKRGWRPLRVLSGGERALLALSFLFSIFLSRPGRDSGAFCVLDEAEAALDDLNLARFLAVVDSYRANGQYLLVTHQKRTMAAADVLYGVVQDASGATTVVSKRMQGE